MRLTIFSSLVSGLLITAGIVSCTDHNPLRPRVPPGKLEEAKGLQAPFGDARKASPAIVAEGKKLFQGKGSCTHCHGASGKGDGTAAHMFQPHPPTDFTNCRLHEVREDGELFWALDNGSPGTGMVDHVHDGKLTEEEAWKIVAYLRTLCEFK